MRKISERWEDIDKKVKLKDEEKQNYQDSQQTREAEPEEGTDWEALRKL